MAPLLRAMSALLPLTSSLAAILNTSGSASESTRKSLVFVVYIAICLVSNFWQSQVTKIVPEPYLDEVFHIPQAQAYCRGQYHVWDPKLTTPPGLYGFSTLFTKLWAAGMCNVDSLRLFNSVILLMTMFTVCECRGLITRIWKTNSALDSKFWMKSSASISPNALHTAVNVALFPPLFFFSGLFYTDVLSTGIVLKMFELFLHRKGAYTNSAEGSLWLYVIGIVALTVRQTNIFWAAVFMGGLEVVRSIKRDKRAPVIKSTDPHTWQETAISAFNRFRSGDIHDIPLKDAGIHDFALCPISIAIAAIYRPIFTLTRLWPYLALLTSFTSFVVWNGGVVLGDKTNHVATIHLPQMLYIWPFIAFFSAPLLVSSAISLLLDLTSLVHPHPQRGSEKQPVLFWKYLLAVLCIGVALVTTLLIIKYNTIIHPFTLADNRHYVFYVFRYSILRGPFIRYALAPIYLICAFLAYLTLAGSSISIAQLTSTQQTAPLKEKPEENTFDMASKAGGAGTASEKDMKRIDSTNNQGPTTSFFLIWILTTALSLITAPLVEPRYFILPWVMWRLHVPSLHLRSPTRAFSRDRDRSAKEGKPISESLKSSLTFWLWEGHDVRLWVETLWFLLINAVTGYIFLFKTFEWPQEPGKVQRFMW